MGNRQIIAGVDEAGRGPLAGPVVAAAVIIPKNKKIITGLNDSKQLSEKQREELYVKIIADYDYGIGIVSEKKIDKINILQATFVAMRQAVAKLKVKPTKCLIDGNKIIPGLEIDQEAIVQGDSKIKVISAASIIAKVTRDRLMLKYHKKYPQYNFAQNKGYGTQKHIAAVLKHGYSAIHRKTFTIHKKEQYV